MSELADTFISCGSDVSAQPTTSASVPDTFLTQRESFFSQASPVSAINRHSTVTSSLTTAALPLSSTLPSRPVSSFGGRRKGTAVRLYVPSESVYLQEKKKSSEDKEKGSESRAQEETAVNVVTNDNACIGLNLLQHALNLCTKIVGSVASCSFDVMRLTKKRLRMSGFFVFLFFLLVFIFILYSARERIGVISKVVLHKNEQHLMFVASLTDQLFEKKNELNKLMKLRPKSFEEIKKAKAAIKEITALQEENVKRLHSYLLYPGPVDDIKFLLEEHIAHKKNLARLFLEELKWLDEKKKLRHIGGKKTSFNAAAETDGKKRQDKQGKDRLLTPPKLKVVLQGSTGDSTIVNQDEHIGSLLDIFVYWLRNRFVIMLLLAILCLLYFRLD